MTRRLLAPIAFALLLLTAGSASASVDTAGGFKYVTETGGKLPGSKSKAFEAMCPGDTHVLSGGMTSNGGFGEVGYTGIPIDDGDKGDAPDDGWRAVGFSFSDRNLKVNVKAVCSELKPRYRTDSEKVSAQSERNVSLTCKGPGSAVGGGFVGKGMGTNSGYPEGGRWVMFADNYSLKTQKVDTAVVCLKSNVQVDSSSASGLPANTPGGGFSSCFSGKFGIGGGVSNSGVFGEFGERAASITASGYGYEIDNYSDRSIDYTIFTICHQPLN
jgi:hypothetical protein